ncbi:hypothetical protein GCM10009596_23470 [Arthrobacter rhombi]|uniref:hypothetical protein n=1 Tax=Arthrobacter rhombi TaxID=71253 RepID=UPI0031E0AB3B
MSDANEMRAQLSAHLTPGETMNQPKPASLNPDDQPEWQPPALNDNRALKAQIIDAIEGKTTPEQTTPFDDFKTQAAAIQAGINRLNQNN